MKKNILGTAVPTAVLVSGALSAYSGSPEETAAADTTATTTGTQVADSEEEGAVAAEAETTQASAELREIMVGTGPTPYAEILSAAREALVSKSYELKIVGYTDYVQPNNTPDSGDLDANYSQRRPYLNSSNTQDGTKLVSAGAIHYKLFGIYVGRTASPKELPDKTTILMPNGVSSEVRALLLLEVQEPIKLKDDVGLEAIKNDITENTKDLDIVELEAVQLPRFVSDSDIAVISGNYAIEAGLKVSDALTTKSSQSLTAATYGNTMAVREGEESSDATKALMEILTSPKTEQPMGEAYEGAVVPLF